MCWSLGEQVADYHSAFLCADTSPNRSFPSGHLLVPSLQPHLMHKFEEDTGQAFLWDHGRTFPVAGELLAGLMSAGFLAAGVPACLRLAPSHPLFSGGVPSRGGRLLKGNRCLSPAQPVSPGLHPKPPCRAAHALNLKWLCPPPQDLTVWCSVRGNGWPVGLRPPWRCRPGAGREPEQRRRAAAAAGAGGAFRGPGAARQPVGQPPHPEARHRGRGPSAGEAVIGAGRAHPSCGPSCCESPQPCPWEIRHLPKMHESLVLSAACTVRWHQWCS